VVNSTHNPSDIMSVLDRIKRDGFVGEDGHFYIDNDQYLYNMLTSYMNDEPPALEPIDIIDTPRVLPPVIQHQATTAYQLYVNRGDCRDVFTPSLSEADYTLVCKTMECFKGGRVSCRDIQCELKIGSTRSVAIRKHYVTLIHALSQ
jgi:hypothetical protein